jgi:GAF domain-containing protein
MGKKHNSFAMETLTMAKKRNNKLDEILQPLIRRLVFKKTVDQEDLDIILEITIKKVVHMLKALSVTLYLVEEDDKIHFSHVYFSDALYKNDRIKEKAYKDKEKELKNIVLNKNQGIVGDVITKGESYLCFDAQQDTHFFSDVDKTTGFVTESLITVPLKADNKNIGAIQIINKETGGAFSEEDMQLLEHVASYSAKIIQKV